MNYEEAKEYVEAAIIAEKLKRGTPYNPAMVAVNDEVFTAMQLKLQENRWFNPMNVDAGTSWNLLTYGGTMLIRMRWIQKHLKAFSDLK